MPHQRTQDCFLMTGNLSQTALYRDGSGSTQTNALQPEFSVGNEAATNGENCPLTTKFRQNSDN